MKPVTIKLLIIAVIMFAASSAFASYSYDFNVNTSSLDGQTGYIELQYNPGPNSAGSGTATISNFISDSTIVGSAVLTGDATGQLPGTVTIKNGTPWNDYFQQVTFGKATGFDLNLSSTADNSFGLSFWDYTGSNPVLTKDLTNGFATIVNVNLQGAATVINNSSQVTTPIPAAVYMFGSGLLGLAGIRRKVNN